MKNNAHAILAFLFVSVFSSALLASDFAKEQRWIDQVADSIIDGDVEMLKVGDREIFSIYTEADENAKHRAMIVVHGLGVHPNWSQVVQPVRVEMTQKGWNTLSIQMPILANGIEGKEYRALFDDVAPRMQAAIDFLQEQSMKDIVLVSHSMGSAMSTYYMAKNTPTAISRFVAVGLGDASFVGGIKIPMLDLFGSKDLPGVLSGAKARASAANNAGNTKYQQQVVQGAEHFFDGFNEQLIGAIDVWLK